MWISNFIYWCNTGVNDQTHGAWLPPWLAVHYIRSKVSLCCILWTFVRIALFTCSKNFILSFVSPWLRLIGMNMGSLYWKWYLKRYYMVFSLAISLSFNVISSVTSINYRPVCFFCWHFIDQVWFFFISTHKSYSFLYFNAFPCILGPREKGTSWKVGWTSCRNN
jgi:hypothetical protein